MSENWDQELAVPQGQSFLVLLKFVRYWSNVSFSLFVQFKTQTRPSLAPWPSAHHRSLPQSPTVTRPPHAISSSSSTESYALSLSSTSFNYAQSISLPASTPRQSPMSPADYSDTASPPASSPDEAAYSSNYDGVAGMHGNWSGGRTFHAERSASMPLFAGCNGPDFPASSSASPASAAPAPFPAATASARPAAAEPHHPLHSAARPDAAALSGACAAPFAPFEPLLPAIPRAVSAAAAADPFHDDWPFW